MNKAILDNFGIRINFNEYPRFSELQQAKANRWGVGFFGQLWCKHLRPIICPIAHVLAISDEERETLAFRHWVLNTLIETGLDRVLGEDGNE